MPLPIHARAAPSTQPRSASSQRLSKAAKDGPTEFNVREGPMSGPQKAKAPTSPGPRHQPPAGLLGPRCWELPPLAPAKVSLGVNIIDASSNVLLVSGLAQSSEWLGPKTLSVRAVSAAHFSDQHISSSTHHSSFRADMINVSGHLRAPKPSAQCSRRAHSGEIAALGGQPHLAPGGRDCLDHRQGSAGPSWATRAAALPESKPNVGMAATDTAQPNNFELFGARGRERQAAQTSRGNCVALRDLEAANYRGPP